MKVMIYKSELANREAFFRETVRIVGECAGAIAVIDGEKIEYTFPADVLPEFNQILSRYK